MYKKSVMTYVDKSTEYSVELPDVAKDKKPTVAGTLDKVGMNHIEVLVKLQSDQGAIHIPGKAKAYVNLNDPHEKGIHMSRLFTIVHDSLNQDPVSPSLISKILHDFVASHDGSSDSAYFEVAFDYPIYREALISRKKGLRFYPVVLSGKLSPHGLKIESSLQVAYSSTCPCSAALARQLIQQQFSKDFSGKPVSFDEVFAWLGTEDGIVATPHSQRSYADIKLQLSPEILKFNFLSLIDLVEDVLKTPVQAAVKREDEQEFALLNGRNLMFCEDAARRLKNALNSQSYILDFWLKASHVESLHPHDAVAIAVKGIKDGYQA